MRGSHFLRELKFNRGPASCVSQRSQSRQAPAVTLANGARVMGIKSMQQKKQQKNNDRNTERTNLRLKNTFGSCCWPSLRNTGTVGRWLFRLSRQEPSGVERDGMQRQSLQTVWPLSFFFPRLCSAAPRLYWASFFYIFQTWALRRLQMFYSLV